MSLNKIWQQNSVSVIITVYIGRASYIWWLYEN